MRASRFLTRFFLVISLLAGFSAGSQALPGVQCPGASVPWTLINHPTPNAAPDEREVFRVTAYNLENFLLHVGKWEQTDQGRRQVAPERAKDPKSTEAVGRMLRKMNGDLNLAEEIEGELPTMVQANKDLLNGAYTPYLKHGRDERGIDIGCFLRNGIGFRVTIDSHRDQQWRDPTLSPSNPWDYVHPRDSPGYMLWPDEQYIPAELREAAKVLPFAVYVGEHGKSKRDRPGDPMSTLKRGGGASAVALNVEEYEKTFGIDQPVGVFGDFNGVVGKEDAYRPLITVADLKDAFDLLSAKMPDDLRITQTFHPRDGVRIASQLDYGLVNGAMGKFVIRAGVLREIDDRGNSLPLPATWEERSHRGSDHIPIWVDFDFRRMWAAYLDRLRAWTAANRRS